MGVECVLECGWRSGGWVGGGAVEEGVEWRWVVVVEGEIMRDVPKPYTLYLLLHCRCQNLWVGGRGLVVVVVVMKGEGGADCGGGRRLYVIYRCIDVAAQCMCVGVGEGWGGGCVIRRNIPMPYT